MSEFMRAPPPPLGQRISTMPSSNTHDNDDKTLDRIMMARRPSWLSWALSSCDEASTSSRPPPPPPPIARLNRLPAVALRILPPPPQVEPPPPPLPAANTAATVNNSQHQYGGSIKRRPLQRSTRIELSPSSPNRARASTTTIVDQTLSTSHDSDSSADSMFVDTRLFVWTHMQIRAINFL